VFQPYGLPGGQPLRPPHASGLAIASMVLGIIGVPLFVLVVPSLLAVIFGAVSLRQIKARPHELTGRGMAIAGIVTGATAFVIILLLIVLGAASPAVSQEPPAGTTSVQKPAELGEYRIRHDGVLATQDFQKDMLTVKLTVLDEANVVRLQRQVDELERRLLELEQARRGRLQRRVVARLLRVALRRTP